MNSRPWDDSCLLARGNAILPEGEKLLLQLLLPVPPLEEGPVLWTGCNPKEYTVDRHARVVKATMILACTLMMIPRLPGKRCRSDV